jgi:glucan phosphoethanolaminetransferase (alkaline phosphatase superfamily)
MNTGFLLAAILSTAALCLHFWRFEFAIWPALKKRFVSILDANGQPESVPLSSLFPTTRLLESYEVMTLYRVAWHLFTAFWLAAVLANWFCAFGSFFPFVGSLIAVFLLQMILFVVAIFLVTAISLRPGDSFLKNIFKSYDWMILLLNLILMYWGSTSVTLV